MEQCIFYKEWLHLPKAQFNILAMIAASGGHFEGNLTDICNYLSVTPQSRNKGKIKESINALKSEAWIDWEQVGRTLKLSVNPQATEVDLPLGWVISVIKHDYSSEGVAWANVLKLFIWIVENKGNLSTNKDIAATLGVSESTVCSAKNVLEKEFEIITKRKVSDKIGEDRFITIGQILEASAFGNKEKY